MAAVSVKERARAQRRCKDHGRKRRQPTQRAVGGQTQGVAATCQLPARQCKADQRTASQQRREQTGLSNAEVQNLAAVGLEHHILHVEGCRTEAGGPQKTPGAALRDEALPAVHEDRLGLGLERRGAHRIAGFLFPEGDAIEHERDHRGSLHHLNENLGSEVGEQDAKGHATAHHAHEQHHVHEGHHAGARFFGGQIGGQRQARRLCGLQPDSGHEERQGGRCLTHKRGHRNGAQPRQHQQCKGHDGQAKELHQRACPDEGHATPAKGRAMGIRTKAGKRTGRCHQHRQRHHQGHQPGRDAELDNHDAVERAHGQCERHTHRDLKQRQTQQTAERQPCTGRISKGQIARRHLPHQLAEARRSHPAWLHSMACEV